MVSGVATSLLSPAKNKKEEEEIKIVRLLMSKKNKWSRRTAY